MLAFGNTSGQEVESASHCLLATRGHHSSYLTGQDTVCFNSCAIAVVASLQESIAVAYFVWLRSLLRLGEEANSL